jgi:hypothetical protein
MDARAAKVEISHRHVQHRVPRRDAPPKRHAAGSNSARNVKIPFPFIDQAVTPPKRCLACVRYDPDTGNPNLTPMRVSSQRQVWPRRHLRKPDRIMSKMVGVLGKIPANTAHASDLVTRASGTPMISTVLF